MATARTPREPGAKGGNGEGRNRPKHNVLITGVSSTAGRHLAMHLAADPRIGFVLGTAPGPRPRFLAGLDPKRFLYLPSDILRPRQVRDLFHGAHFKEHGIDTVVHLAFVSHPNLKGRKVHRLNVEGTKGLLDRCMESGRVRKFVFKSSDAVYKLDPSTPVYLDENADLNHDPEADQWVQDRVAAEMICRSRMDSAGMDVVILRFASIVGRNVGGQMNAYFDGRFVFKALGYDPLLNLVHMKDVIEAIRLAILKNTGSGIFNIAGADTATVTTFAELNGRRCIALPEHLLEVVNWAMRRLKMTDYYYSVDRDRMRYTCLLDTTRAREILGYAPTRSIEFREYRGLEG
jgi:UDP-glucose 4-epimerase